MRGVERRLADLEEGGGGGGAEGPADPHRRGLYRGGGGGRGELREHQLRRHARAVAAADS